MSQRVVLARAAKRDIEAIWRFIAENDSAENANRVLVALQGTIKRLTGLPSRGNVPKELLALGNTEYREAHFKPYRIIYQVTADAVTVYGVFDGRRDMLTLLKDRLLRPR
ncbi:type II toxin-antitoxin system RelE/ParE family toxin [Inquilinus sp.]|uniref:type II toxin-antitoxin system RelE/ParE family toxin n=1 Tax=Inquilinus sp. TaxID=1932117 RepID=UPI0031CDD2C0